MELLGSKTVQEVLIQGEQVPEKYIHKVEDGGVQVPNASAAQLMDVPVIDLALLAASSISVDELEKLRSSLATWGCFQGNSWHAESTNQNGWYGVGTNDASQFSYGTAVCIEHALDWGPGSGEMTVVERCRS
ncbi:hypothetical protein ACFX2I_014639 [Malus domestica]